LVTDGELMRFDPSHPETNGMVDYSCRKWTASASIFFPFGFRALPRRPRFGFRAVECRMVVDKIGDGTLNLLRDLNLSARSRKRPSSSPAPGRTCSPEFSPTVFTRMWRIWRWTLPRFCGASSSSSKRDVVQLDEAGIVGNPEDAAWAAEAVNHVLDGVLNEKAVHICFGNYGGQPMLRGFWRDLIPF